MKLKKVCDAMIVVKWLMLIAFMLFMSVIAFAHDEK